MQKTLYDMMREADYMEEDAFSPDDWMEDQRKTDKERYELIAGERRLRAAILVGLTSVAAIVKKFSEEHSMVLSIIENIQRDNLLFLPLSRLPYVLTECLCCSKFIC